MKEVTKTEFFNNLAVTSWRIWFESKQCVLPVTSPTHSTDRRHPLTGDSRCGSHNRQNWHHLSLSQNWCGRCGPFSSRLSIRLMPLTGHPRQKRRWRNEFCGRRQMDRARLAVLCIGHVKQGLTELQIAQLGLDRIAEPHTGMEQREAEQTKLGFDFIAGVD